jgi:hypothetical protein
VEIDTDKIDEAVLALLYLTCMTTSGRGKATIGMLSVGYIARA